MQNKSVKAFLMEFARHSQKLFKIVNCMMVRSGLQIFSKNFHCGKNNIFNLLLMTGERLELYPKSCINEEAKNTIQIADPQCSKYFIHSSNAQLLNTYNVQTMGEPERNKGRIGNEKDKDAVSVLKEAHFLTKSLL